MSKVAVYNICGEKVGELELLKEIFDVEINRNPSSYLLQGGPLYEPPCAKIPNPLKRSGL